MLLDGEAVKSCTVLAVQADGASVTTLEGLADGGRRAASGAGRVPRRARAAVRLLHAGHGDGRVGLLAENPHPTEQQVREGLEGNFCRCTGYHNIVRAVLAAADAWSVSMIPAAFEYVRAGSVDEARLACSPSTATTPSCSPAATRCCR